MLVVFLIASLAGAPAANAIVGGSPTTDEYLHLASLQVTAEDGKPRHSCAATAISPEWMVTNAHCVDTTLPPVTAQSSPAERALWHARNALGKIGPGATFTVRLGSTDNQAGGALRDIGEVVLPPGWAWGKPDSAGRIWDVALLRTTQPVGMGHLIDVRPIRSGSPLDLPGWGMISGDPADWDQPERYLRHTTVQQMPFVACAAAGIGVGELCLDGGINVGPCAGDSGGSALQTIHGKRVAIGSVSRGTACGGANVFTNLADSVIHTWIRATVRSDEWVAIPATQTSTFEDVQVSRNHTPIPQHFIASPAMQAWAREVVRGSRAHPLVSPPPLAPVSS